MPKVSIITTTYKHQDFIAHTIKSVLSQTYTDRELLIGDDSPDDTTWEIIQEYIDKYPDKIKARHHKPNKGIVDNMNFLIDQADSQSEYISFLEWDDMYTPDNLQEKMKVFEQYPDVSLVYSDLSFIDKNWNKLSWWNIWLSNKWISNRTLENLLKIWNPIHSFSAVIIHKNILPKMLPLDVPMWYRWMYWPLDYWTWTRILPNVVSFGLNKRLLLYRRQNNNYTKQVTLFNQQLELIYIYYQGKSKQTHNICRKFMCINKIIWNMFAWKSSFIYLYGQLSYLSLKDLMKCVVFSSIWLLPNNIIDQVIEMLQYIKHRNA
jgi:glycosyltransferase involved in cell wall biosynthesis